MKLLIVILNYRITDLTIECLRSLEGRVERIPGTRVAVCENGTGGDAPRRLRDAIATNGWGSWVDLTVVHPNRGFTGGNNLVIRAALASHDPPEYVLLLNGDTIVQDGALEALVTFMDGHPRAGIAGSRLLSPGGEVQGSPYRFMSIATELDRGLRVGVVSRLLSRWALVVPPPTQPCSVDWVSGASMILRRRMLDETGLLDEGLYTYFDDIDICMRARKAGWETWFVPQSRIVHMEGASTGLHRRDRPAPEYLFQARRRFFLKNYGRTYTAVVDAAWILGFSLWRMRRWAQQKPDPDPPSVLADSIRHSVFWAGFEVPWVENPAMARGQRESVGVTGEDAAAGGGT